LGRAVKQRQLVVTLAQRFFYSHPLGDLLLMLAMDLSQVDRLFLDLRPCILWRLLCVLVFGHVLAHGKYVGKPLTFVVNGRYGYGRTSFDPSRLLFDRDVFSSIVPYFSAFVKDVRGDE
jgi:hypothetical protein